LAGAPEPCDERGKRSSGAAAGIDKDFIKASFSGGRPAGGDSNVGEKKLWPRSLAAKRERNPRHKGC